MSKSHQQHFDIDVRPASIAEISIGQIVSLVMRAHRVDAPAGMGWYTGEFEDILEEIILEDVEDRVSIVLGDRAQLHPVRVERKTLEKQLDEHRSPDPPGEQATLTEMIA